MNTLSVAGLTLVLIAGGWNPKTWFADKEVLGPNLIDTLEWIKRNTDGPLDASRSVNPFKADGSFEYDTQGNITWTYDTEVVEDQFGLVTKSSAVSTFHLSDLDPESVTARHEPVSVIATTHEYAPAIIHTRSDERSRFPKSKLGDRPVQIDTQRLHTTFVIIELDNYAMAQRVAKALRSAVESAPKPKRPSGELF